MLVIKVDKYFTSKSFVVLFSYDVTGRCVIGNGFVFVGVAQKQTDAFLVNEIYGFQLRVHSEGCLVIALMF